MNRALRFLLFGIPLVVASDQMSIDIGDTTATTASRALEPFTTTTAVIEGKFCGSVWLQSFVVTLKKERMALDIPSYKVSGQCDYHVTGPHVEVSNFDDVLRDLMNRAGVSTFDITILDASRLRINAGGLMSTTVERC
ncbi:hypothetical protein Pmar_PMAR026245 [Perkinsus marinus ATCC 50983]|uniref:Uncharacterized protein n=1 Tax=Perkinsus marinus (strain ATCC 50983 / TXsc) TaxID=423536 RepID=C5LI35_PERM5|nr:hypothetical protein Pmar_PMAR026245 [Perkinsus marinus ATCC 50983]EER03570.1 hypothetical protein Pmar_PMAR026245 [Perkinsus marinus ATCC 50983]|eukprot:XP_002771754.1 hypothetical protein Pmar_PMAR026245 [Perkinsus marinus ATCC 50983]